MAEKNKEERKVVTELIELYRDLPCLWDLSCEEYKDNNQKSVGWETLVAKWKEVEPDANVASVKKKIEHLKSSYKREAKKVKDSKKRTGSAANEVHKPNLWYFDLITFLDKKDEQLRTGVDTLSSDNESLQGYQIGKKRGRSSSETHKHKLLETAQELLQQSKNKTDSFGVYVGEQLDSLSTHQRQIAEKLISEVIFMGKTENLTFYSRVETHTRERSPFLSHCSPRLPSPQYRTPSPQYNTSSPQCSTPSPKYVSLSRYSPQIQTQPPPQDDSGHSSSSSLPTQVASTSQNINSYTCQSPQAIRIQSSSLPQYQMTKYLPPSSSHIQTQPTVQSIQYGSLSQHKTQPQPIESPQIQSHPFPSQHQTQPTIIQIAMPSPPSSGTVQQAEEISENIIEGPAGPLLKELLIFKRQQN